MIIYTITRFKGYTIIYPPNQTHSQSQSIDVLFKHPMSINDFFTLFKTACSDLYSYNSIELQFPFVTVTLQNTEPYIHIQLLIILLIQCFNNQFITHQGNIQILSKNTQFINVFEELPIPMDLTHTIHNSSQPNISLINFLNIYYPTDITNRILQNNFKQSLFIILYKNKPFNTKQSYNTITINDIV